MDRRHNGSEGRRFFGRLRRSFPGLESCLIAIVITGCGGVGSTMPGTSKIQTTTNLTAAPTVVTLGGTVTLSASVTYPPAETATGLVSFSDGSVSLGDATLDSKGIASLKLTKLAAGTHSIVARFAGNEAITASMSRPVVVMVMTPSMTSLNQ
jgi:hypothetical protein